MKNEKHLKAVFEGKASLTDQGLKDFFSTGTHAEKSLEKIQAVLDSDLTSYEIAKRVGYSSANQVHNFRSGESDITAMKLSTAMRFEIIYADLFKKDE